MLLKWPRYRRLPFPASYWLWLAPFLLLLITFQVSAIEAGHVRFSLYRTVLLSIYYGVWILFGPFIYGLLELFDQNTWSWKQLPSYTFLILSILVAHLLLSNVLLSATQVYVFGRPENHLSQLPGIWPALLFNRLLTLMLMISILKVIDYFQLLQRTKLQLSDAENKLQKAQLEQLQAQLKPHFLFNSLHAITSLIGYDDPKARELTIHLSEMLRTNLEKEQTPFQTLEEEVNYLQSYIKIQQERFQEIVAIDIRVATEVRQCQIPSLLLQPLIENAFVHGIEGLTEKGILRFAAFEKNGQFQITIENSVNPSARRKNSTGLGLENVKQRLELLYGEKAALSIDQSNNTYIVRLNFPAT